MFSSDFNVEVFVTHLDEKSESLHREQIAIPLTATKFLSPLNNSDPKGLYFTSKDMVRIDINLDISTMTAFSVIIVIPFKDNCSDYEVMVELQSENDCTLGECKLQSSERDDYWARAFLRYCRFSCAKACKVYIRRLPHYGTKYLPLVKIQELAALAI